MAKVFIRAERDGYAPNQLRGTMTVREFIDKLSEFDKDAEVYLSHDNGHTYGAIYEWRIKEV